MRLGLRQTPAVVAAPLLPDAAPQLVTGLERFVARQRPLECALPRLGVSARGNHRLRPSLGYRRVTRLGVVGAVPAAGGGLWSTGLLSQG